ncbi:hypothetical protein B0H13DRAFT_1862468 [Mycena leptocephala]|nr:hypothetical protein B0H13DRAFT_1862468 [Mycena leptocephala]
MKPEEGSTAFNFASSEPVMLSDSRLEAFLDGSVTFRSDEAGLALVCRLPTRNVCILSLTIEARRPGWFSQLFRQYDIQKQFTDIFARRNCADTTATFTVAIGENFSRLLLRLILPIASYLSERGAPLIKHNATARWVYGKSIGRGGFSAGAAHPGTWSKSNASAHMNAKLLEPNRPREAVGNRGLPVAFREAHCRIPDNFKSSSTHIDINIKITRRYGTVNSPPNEYLYESTRNQQPWEVAGEETHEVAGLNSLLDSDLSLRGYVQTVLASH